MKNEIRKKITEVIVHLAIAAYIWTTQQVEFAILYLTIIAGISAYAQGISDKIGFITPKGGRIVAMAISLLVLPTISDEALSITASLSGTMSKAAEKIADGKCFDELPLDIVSEDWNKNAKNCKESEKQKAEAFRSAESHLNTFANTFGGAPSWLVAIYTELLILLIAIPLMLYTSRK